MTDPKLRDHFVDDDALRPSHDMLETAREIRVSPEEQEEEVARETQLRQEQAARMLHEQAVTAYEALVLERRRGRRVLILHAMSFVVGSAALFTVNQVMGGASWVQWPLLAWTLALAGHAAWVFTRAEAVPPPPLPVPNAAEARRASSLRPPQPRPLAGRGREVADEAAQAQARTTQRTTRKRD